MKKRILLVLMCSGILIPVLLAQSESRERLHEIGLSFYGLDAFGIRYKTGTEKDLFRMTTLYGNFSHNQTIFSDQDDSDMKTTSANIGISAGYEHRIAMVKNFQFLIGPDAYVSYGWNKEDFENYLPDQIRNTISAKIGLLLGFNWNIREFLSLSAEVVPGLSYSHSTYLQSDDQNKRSQNSIQFGFSNQSASLTIAYRIHDKAK